MIKTKFLRKLGIFALAFAALFSLGSGFLVPKTASADQEISANDLEIQEDIFINGQASNYIRVGKDGNFTIAGTIRLISPQSITFNSTDITSGPWTLNPEIHDFMIAFKNVKDIGDYKCNDSSSGNTTFMTCKFPLPTDWDSHWNKREGTVYSSGFKQGTILPPTDSTALLNRVNLNTYTISSSQLNSLGITNSSAQGVTHEIYVYPVLVADGDVTNYPVVFKSLGKKVTVIYYDTQVQAQEAEKTQGRPQGVEGYGSTAGNMSAGQTGSGVIGFINWIISGLLGLVNEIVYFFFYWLIAPLIQAMLSIRTYTDTFAAVIYPGWEIVRNVCNMLFIIALIAIALATLFRVESYHFRQLLVQLVIAALLVNFSLAIAQIVLGIADTVQNQFLPNNMGVIRSLGRDLMVSNTRSAFLDKKFVELGQFSETVKLFFYVSMAFGSFVVFAAIAVFLAIRMVMLWILLMLSPIPYIAGILPATAQYRKMWWDNFIKYAFFTPIMAFFLNLAAIIASKTITNPILQTVGDKNLAGELGGDFSEFVFKVGSNILLLMFLFASIKIADLFGIAGAHAATEIAQKGMFAPFAPLRAAGKWAVSRGGEEVRNKIGLPDLKDIKEGWHHYSEEKKHERKLNRMMGKNAIARFMENRGVKNVNLANPHDMFNAYANLTGASRVLKSRFGFRGFNAQLEKNKKLYEHSQILTDTERVDLENDIRQKTDEYTFLDGSDLITKERAKKLQRSVTERVDNTDQKLKALKKEEKELRDKGLSVQADKVADHIKETENVLTGLASVKDQLDKQVDNPGQRMVNMGAIVGSLAANRDARDYLHDYVYDKDHIKEQINSTLTKDREAAEKDDRVREELGFKRYGEADARPVNQVVKDELRGEYDKGVKLAGELRRPEAYFTRVARHEAERDEGKKISDVEDSDELIRYYEDAIREHNFAKGAAIVKKLAKDANFNEILGHSNLPVNFKGTKAFFDKMQHDFHISKEQKFQLASEVGYINEEANWWGLARLTKLEDTGIDWNSEEGQSGAIYAEMSKRFPQRIGRDFSRIAFVEQSKNAKGGWDSIAVHKAGRALIKQLDSQEKSRNEFIAQVRPNTAAAIVRVPNWDEVLRSDGVTEEMINGIRNRAGDERGVIHLAGGETMGGSDPE